MKRRPSVLPHTNQLSTTLLLLITVTCPSPPPPLLLLTLQLSSTMPALWIHAVSLLVLLVTLWPGSQAAASPQYLCGSHLIDALFMVCGDKGFSYIPKGACCDRPCSIFDLESYCN